ncbi:MAG: glycosyltransferase [Thermoflexales bacterium]
MTQPDLSRASNSVPWPRRVLVLHEAESFGGDFDESFKAGLEQNGCEVMMSQRTAPWFVDVDAVLGYGPFSLQTGDMLPAGRWILAMPPEKRPAMLWVLTEGVPDPRIPGRLVEPAAKFRLFADRVFGDRVRRLPSRYRRLLLVGHRLRIFGQLKWLNQRSVLTCLGVTSASRARYLSGHQLRPIVTPLGYHPVYGADLGLQRDIDVAFIGNLDSPRRRRLLPGLFASLEDRGIKVNVQSALYGDERSQFLNRCRIIINVLRAEQDFVGQRFLLAAANNALIVSEPLNDAEPFVPGRHIVVAALEQLADTVTDLLGDEPRRAALAHAAHTFVTRELTVGRMIGAILAESKRVRSEANLV